MLKLMKGYFWTFCKVQVIIVVECGGGKDGSLESERKVL
jgi:hypothetical protein